MKKMVDEIAVDEEGLERRFPINYKDYINWLAGKVSLVPEEFRDSATVVFSLVDSYGVDTIRFTMSYERPEMDEEEAKRERRERQREELQESIDKQTFENLKKKYGW